jgi:hypothetical protein
LDASSGGRDQRRLGYIGLAVRSISRCGTHQALCDRLTYAVGLSQDPAWVTFEPCGNPQGADLGIYAISGQKLRDNRPLG